MGIVALGPQRKQREARGHCALRAPKLGQCCTVPKHRNPRPPLAICGHPIIAVEYGRLFGATRARDIARPHAAENAARMDARNEAWQKGLAGNRRGRSDNGDGSR